MRKVFIILVAILGFSSISNAQDFKIHLGPYVIVTPGTSFGVDATLNAKHLAMFDSGISLGLNAGVDLNFTGGVSFSVAAGPSIVFDINRGRGDAYFGLALGLAGGGGGTAFIFGFAGGIEYQVSPLVNLFSNIHLFVVPGTFGSLDMGADFNISRSIALYAKLVVGFGGAFGFGAGLAFTL